MPKIIISDYMNPAYTSIIRLWFNNLHAYYDTTVHPLVAKGLSQSNPFKNIIYLYTDICHYNCLHSIYSFRLSSLLYAHVIGL